MDYRREIDGLRALAVLPVILFHGGFHTFSGGFVGVDVFFVISGYLITTIILSELEAGKFSIINFYERRARRILPALFLIMFVCFAFAWLWEMPRDMKDFSESLIAVSLFASNILFWRKSGYFDTAAELKPLLHTWSLAVEEQYYLLFPIFLMVTWRLGRRWCFGLFAVVFVISLALAQWGSSAKPVATFYLLPTRGWELLIGAFAAIYLFRNENVSWKVLREGLGILGLALLLYSIFAFDKRTPFPSLFTLVPAIGTALIILCATKDTFVGRLLGIKAFVGVGLISYSVYLWHQPLFAFARYKSDATPSRLLILNLTFLSVLLAFFSWKYVETPFRKKGRFSKKQVFKFALFGSLFLAIVGVIGIKTDGYRGRISFPPNIEWMSLGDRIDVQGNVCTPTPDKRYEGLNTCYFGKTDSDNIIVLYGDSHSQSISRILDSRMRNLGFKVVKIETGCGVIFDITSSPGDSPRQYYETCNRKFSEVQRLIRDKSASTLLVTRWTFQYFPMPGFVEILPFDNGEGGVEKDLNHRENVALSYNGNKSYNAKEKKEATIKLIRGLSDVSKTLYISYPIPEMGWDIFKINVEYFKKNKDILQTLDYPYERYLERNKFILQILNNELVFATNIVPLRPDLIFCHSFSTGRCVGQWKGVPFYYDDDHLSDEGANLLIEGFVKHLKKS